MELGAPDLAAGGAAFLTRLQSRGARSAKPADFRGWLVAVGFLLTAGWVAWQGLNLTVAAVLAIVGLVTVGLPHGQFDWRMAQASLAPRLGKRWAPVFLSVYLGLAGLMVALWVWSPVLGFVWFLAFSVLHFGLEDHQAGLSAQPLPIFISLLVRGALPFIVPAVFHTARMAWWVAEITGTDQAEVLIQLQTIVSILGPVWLVGAGVLIGLYTWKDRTGAAAEFTAAAIALAVLPLVPGFLLWFIIGHSPRHLLQVFEAEPPGGRGAWLARQLGLGAVVSALLLGVLAAGAHVVSPLWAVRVAVVGLAAVTLPHLLACAFLQPRQTLRGRT